MILAPVGDFPQDLLEELSFRTAIPMGGRRINLDVAFDAGRRQYHSTILIEELKKAYPGTVIGATSLDLFIPVLTFVFGEAEMPGRAAIFSMHRLRQEFYGLPPDGDLLIERSLKELNHELGHTAGLAHCRDPFCVMSSSASVERVDSKDTAFCPACDARVRSRSL